MDEIALLEDQERTATAALRAAQQKKRELLQAQQAEAEALEAAAQAAYVAKLKPKKELAILGVTPEKLRAMNVPALTVLHVHKGIDTLLRAALAYRTEVEFHQVVTALALRLVSGRRYIQSTIEQLRTAEDSKHYYVPSSEDVVLVIAGAGDSALMSDLVTTYALEYGRITNYEEQE